MVRVCEQLWQSCVKVKVAILDSPPQVFLTISVYVSTGFQARSKDQEILEEGGGAGPSLLPRRDHE